MVRLASYMLLAALFVACNDANRRGQPLSETLNMQAGPKEKGQPEIIVMWVNSNRVDCTGVAPMKCLQVQFGEELKPESWQFFYDQIEGFEYVEGYVYKLKVERTKQDFPDGQTPADASAFQYVLIAQLSKEPEG